MKYENTICFIGIVLISLSIAFVGASQSPEQVCTPLQKGNVIKMNVLAGEPEGYINIGDDTILQTMPTIFKVTVTGEQTYTFTTRSYIDVVFDMSQPNQINATMVQTIKDFALSSCGFTLTNNKIRYNPYTQGNNQ